MEGVAKVSMDGVLPEAIYVEISRENASALGISVARVYQILSQQNAVVSAVETSRLSIVSTESIAPVGWMTNRRSPTPTSPAETTAFCCDSIW